MSALDPVLRIVEGLSRRLDGKPDLRWAVVTQAAPLRIRLDADEQELLAAPDSLVSPLVVGDRVRVALQNRRVTVLGVAGGAFKGDTDGAVALPGAPENATIGPEGVKYQIRSGWVTISADFQGTFAPGTRSYWSGIPAWLSPAEPSLVFAATFLSDVADVAFVRPNGTIGFANSTSVNKARCRFTATYPLRKAA